MLCFCQLPCSTTNDGLLVCNHYISSVGETVCLFILHNVNVPHLENSTIPVACQCARCLATLSIATRTSYTNGVLIPFDHFHCHACGNFCMIRQSTRYNANRFRFFVVCASARLNFTVQINTIRRPSACRTFFAWADFLRTTPNGFIAQHINRLPVLKRKNDDDDNDEVRMIRSQQIPAVNNGQGDAN